MASPAATKFSIALEKAICLRDTVNSSTDPPISSQNKQVYYHAALTANVSAWDSYINQIVNDFYDLISNPIDLKYQAIFLISKSNSDRSLQKFNTPSFENSRNLLVYHTGYDPINDWVLPQRSMNSLAVKNRLNEILKVRHSFAHGFSMPNYLWNQSPTGKIRLTKRILIDIESFLKSLVRNTDKGMKLHIRTAYGIISHW